VKCAIQMTSGGTIYIPSFMKIGTGVQSLLGENTHVDTQTHTHTHTQSKQGDLITVLLLLSFKRRK
jgi:hypothetical protein